MTRIVWSLGFGGLVLALLASLWLGRPVDPPRTESPRTESLTRTGPPHRPPLVARLEQPEPETPPSPSAPAPSAPVPDTVATPWPRSTRAHRKLPPQRLRVVSALRADYPTPLARRDAVLAAFQASGESQEPWTTQARTALDSWRTTIETDVLPVRAESPRCFAAGCVTRITFPDSASYEEARQRVPGLKFVGVGPHLQLPAEHLPSGEVVVSWAVLPPEKL